MRSILAAIALAPLLASPAWADRPGADACAAGLEPSARLIYDATLPEVKPGVVLRDVIRTATRSLVMDGKIERAVARDKAEAAGQCLQIVLK